MRNLYVLVAFLFSFSYLATLHKLAAQPSATGSMIIPFRTSTEAIHATPDDPFARRANKQSQVRTLTKIRVLPIAGVSDTAVYEEFDRRGNKTALYDPTFRVHNQLQYNLQDQCVQYRFEAPLPIAPYNFVANYEPSTHTTTIHKVLPNSGLELYQRITKSQQADTTYTITKSYKSANDTPIAEWIERRYPYHQDTFLLKYTSYNAQRATPQVTIQYVIEHGGNVIESGSVRYTVAVEKPSQIGSNTQQVHRALSKPTFTVRSRTTYDSNGQLSSKYVFFDPTEYITVPSAPTPVTQKPQIASIRRVTRNKQGRVMREEIGSLPNPESPATYEEFTYFRRGLLLTSKDNRVNNQEQQYRYVYTFY